MRPLCLTSPQLVVAGLHDACSSSACHGLLRGCRACVICIHFHLVLCYIVLSLISPGPLTCAGATEATQTSLAASPVAAPQAEPASSPAGPDSCPAGQAQTAGQPWGVSATEMMTAVRDMLAAADVPLDLERSQLLQQTLELRAQLQGTQSRLTTAEQVAALCAGRSA